MSFLRIVQPDETFPYTPTFHDGSPSDTTLTLRVIGEAQTRALRKKHTKVEWVNGQRVSSVDGMALGEDIIDAAIVAWEGVLDTKGQPLPCERTFKLLLPERVQADIVRQCAGKEAGAWEGEVGGSEGEARSRAI